MPTGYPVQRIACLLHSINNLLFYGHDGVGMDCGMSGKVGKGRAGGMDKAGDDNGAVDKAPDKAGAKGKAHNTPVSPWLPTHFLI